MNIIAIAVTGVLFILGLFIGRISHPTKTTERLAHQNTPTPTITQTPPAPTTTPVVMGASTSQISSATTPNPASPPQPTSIQTKSSVSLNSFVYPSSTVTNQTGDTIQLTSSDDATTITNWYSNQFTAQGFSSKSQAKTNSNGNILNKLGASKDGQQVLITVTKQPSSSTVQITVSLTTGSSDNSVRIEIHNNTTTTQ